MPPMWAPPSVRAETMSSLRPHFVEFFLVARDGLENHMRRDVAFLPADHLDPTPFEILVDEEEVLDLLERMLREVGDVEVLLIERVVARDSENLVVRLMAVEHLQNAERTAVD